MSLVTAIAYVLGMYFIFTAIVKFKHFGESRTMMSSEHSIMTPIIMLAVGTALLYLPSSVQVGMSTFWTNPNPYAYVEQQDQWSQFINGCFIVIQLIGTIAFIRGLVLLSHVGGHQSSQGNFGKGLTQVIAGVFCINIYQFVQVILATIGIQT
jgi:intracellular multiplication protein IcmC